MKIRTNNFKEEIAKLGRQIDFKINLHINDRLITQDNQFIITQDNLKLIVEQFNEDDIDETIGAEDIYNATIVNKGNLLSTMMKEFDFEISEELRLGDVVDCSFGLKVDEEYEYINYGKYIIYSKEKNEDTNTYSYVAFDSMLLSMVEVDDTSIIQGITVQQAIENICDKVGLNVNITADDVEDYPNLENVINENAFNGIEMTYRDVLDMICQCLGLSMIVEDKELKLKALNDEIVDTFDGNYLKDTNVKFSDKYMINSVVLSRSEDNDNIYRQDSASIAVDGVHEFKIKDNLIMQYDDREDYIDEIFEQLNGVEFYINDFTSTGITYLDWLDYYNVEIDDNIYKCLMLSDEIKIQQGLEESIYTEMPEETVTDYKISSKTDKEVSFIVDKQNGEIKSRVTQDEMESAINQTAEEINIEVRKKVGNDEIISKINQSAEQIQIEANKISLEGKQIDLTSDNIRIDSDNFSVDENGNMICSNANITGGSINLTSSNELAKFKVISSTNPNSYVEISPAFYQAFSNGNAKLIISNLLGIIRVNDSTNSNIHTSLSGNLIDLYNQNETRTIRLYATTGEITCVSLTQTSKEESKKNFEKYENALEQVKNTDIYKYNLKTENDDKKKHVGFVIGKDFNYSHDITAIDENNEETGVDTYSMVSVLWQAVKEQQEQIEELKEQIKSLRGDEL